MMRGAVMLAAGAVIGVLGGGLRAHTEFVSPGFWHGVSFGSGLVMILAAIALSSGGLFYAIFDFIKEIEARDE